MDTPRFCLKALTFRVTISADDMAHLSEEQLQRLHDQIKRMKEWFAQGIGADIANQVELEDGETPRMFVEPV